MKITVKQENGFVRKALQENTHRETFSSIVDCVSCKEGRARPLMVIEDDEGLVSEQRPGGDGIWPHNPLAIALYLCPDCGRITARWSQG